MDNSFLSDILTLLIITNLFLGGQMKLRTKNDDCIPIFLPVRITHTLHSLDTTNISNFNSSSTSKRWKWENDIDYDKVAEAVLNRFRGNDEDSQPYFVTYFVDSSVGFANQFRSLCSVFLLAVGTGRKLRINWNDYFNVTDSYFKELRYNKTKDKNNYGVRGFGINKSTLKKAANISYDFDKLMGKRNSVILSLTDISGYILRNPNYRKTLSRLGFRVKEKTGKNATFYNPESYRDLRGQIARLLLTPNEEISQVIYDNLEDMHSDSYIGLQIRTGGSLARVTEYSTFLSMSSLPFVYQEVNYAYNYLNKDKKEIGLFVSTDSFKMNTIISRTYSDQHVYSAKGYAIGHSSAYLTGSKKHMSFLNRAILDLVLMSQCDYHIFTRKSSYGQLGMRLALNTPARQLCPHNICSPFP